MPHLLRVSYASVATRPHDGRVFERIAQAAARRNPTLGLSGALLFDGESFLHLLEGPPGPLRALLETVTADPRHTEMTGLIEARAPARRFPRWRSRAVAGVAQIAPIALAANDDDARCALLHDLLAG